MIDNNNKDNTNKTPIKFTMVQNNSTIYDIRILDLFLTTRPILLINYNLGYT